MKKFLLFLFLGFLIFSGATLVYAAADEITPMLCSVAKAIYTASWAAIGIAWIVVTVLFLIALGNPEKYSLAKKSIVVAIIGTVVIMLGVSSIKLVANTIGVAWSSGDICSLEDGSSSGCEPPCGPDEYCYQPPGGGPGVCQNEFQ